MSFICNFKKYDNIGIINKIYKPREIALAKMLGNDDYCIHMSNFAI